MDVIVLSESVINTYVSTRFIISRAYELGPVQTPLHSCAQPN